MIQQDHHLQFCIIVDERRTHSLDFHDLFSYHQWESLKGKIQRAGFDLDQVKFYLSDDLQDLPPNAVCVGLGERPLNKFTGKKEIDKWVLSPLQINGTIYIPSYDLGRTQKQYELGLYQEMAFLRAYDIRYKNGFHATEERFLLNPDLDETIAVLQALPGKEELAIDVETGYGQINTVGIAWSESDAIAINVLPERLDDKNFYYLWGLIRDVLEGPSKKIFQNFIYDVSYFSAYGIRVENIHHDTMWAMKFLWPEFKSNLGNVGRFYTMRPYWKDDGRVTDEEGTKKDWGNIRDWTKHYTYNCRDTTGTLESYHSQREDLAGRSLSKIFDTYLIRLVEPIREMCANGLPVSGEVLRSLQKSTEEEIEALKKSFNEKAKDVNPASPKQIQAYLKGLGVSLPKKFDKKKDVSKETVDGAALKKILLKHPDLTELKDLMKIKTLSKALSSYIKFEMKQGESVLRYSLNGCGTETLRWSGSKDPWDRGFNPQTIPRDNDEISIKSIFVAPTGYSFVEIDLKQAESRFVAYDSADSTLIDMLESGHDVHGHVANEILSSLGKNSAEIGREEFKSTWRQLGKKSGHGANYDMGKRRFVETCFDEMDLTLKESEAEKILEAYHTLFPGIRKWHTDIRRELNLRRKLTVPSGWERYFYGRMDANTFREAYAFRPQHTIPWLTNHLMLHLMDERRNDSHLDFRLCVQVHDSLILLVSDSSVRHLADLAFKTDNWHPEVWLPGGRLRVPAEVKAGKTLNQLEEIHQ